MVDTYYNDGQTDQAKSRLKQMREAFPDDAVVRELYLGHLANFGEPELAVPEREALLEKSKQDKNSKDSWPYLALAATYFKNAQKLSTANGKSLEMKANMERAFQTLLAGRNRFPDETRFYSQVAELHQYNGDLPAGEKVLKDFCTVELSKQPPQVVRPDPWLALAEFYTRSGQVDQTVTALEQALAQSNDNLAIRLRLVSAMVQAKQFAAAIQRLDAANADADPRIVRQRLEILIAQGDLASAEKEIRTALGARDAADLRNLMASVLIDTGRAAEAIPEIERALRLDRGNETARYLEALALYRQRPPRIPEAIEKLDKLKNFNPRNVQTRLPAGRAADPQRPKKPGGAATGRRSGQNGREQGAPPGADRALSQRAPAELSPRRKADQRRRKQSGAENRSYLALPGGAAGARQATAAERRHEDDSGAEAGAGKCGLQARAGGHAASVRRFLRRGAGRRPPGA